MEIYHDGLRLPICKLVRAERLDEPMFDVIRSNVRVPEQVFGDLTANITCNEVGARQLLELMDEYALDDLAPLSAAIRGQSERASGTASRPSPTASTRAPSTSRALTTRFASPAAPRSTAGALHDSYPEIDGLYYPSSMHTNRPAMVLNERARETGVVPEKTSFHRSLGDPAILSILRNAAHALGYALL